MKILLIVSVPGVATLLSILGTGDQGYPRASLNQATNETICSLKIERYSGLDEDEMQAEYQWSLDMAHLCFENPLAVFDGSGAVHYGAAIEFQRHAGRTARYRGFLNQALEDYEMAIEYCYDIRRLRGEPGGPVRGYEITTLRDIADTYVIMGGHGPAAELTNVLQGHQQARGKNPLVSSAELNRLSIIRQGEARFGESVSLQEQAVRITQRIVRPYLDPYSELPPADRNLPWEVFVRQADVRSVLNSSDPDDRPNLKLLRREYCLLARALRLNMQLGEAVHALNTAELTPWKMSGSWRENLDLWVDREWAFLAMARREVAEAVRRGEDCLSKYADSISPSERVELLDLVSRGLERMGEPQGAFDRLKEAIAIVEERRANLALDEHKQMYIGQHAGLYRRACELVIRIGTTNPSHSLGKDGAPVGFDRRTAVESFEWAERAKARAMLDSMRRLGRRMAKASASGEVREITLTREMAGEVVGIDRLRKAPWMDKHVALVEYMLSPRGAWVWVVRRDAVNLVRLEASPEEVKETAHALRDALLPNAPRDDKWKKPATWLHDALIRPIDARIGKASHLVIVGDGALREIPFETFIDRTRNADEQLLIQRKTIVYAPSATVLDHASTGGQATSGTRSASGTRAAWHHDYWGFASTRFHSSKGKIATAKKDDTVAMVLRATRGLDDLAPLPSAGKEVERAAERFPDGRSETFVDYLEAGQSAKDKLLSASKSGELRGVRHLHFATHALLDSNRPFDSGLVLSPPYVDTMARVESRKSKSERSGFRRSTFNPRLSRRASILSLHEIGELKLGCELVVLSSCQAIGASPVDGDWLNGLTRAFLVAGSRAVICTLWDVSDTDAGRITPEVYRAIRAPHPQSPADALRTAKLSLLPSSTRGHPSRWAGFVCYGGLESLGR